MDNVQTMIRKFHKDPKHSKVGLCGFGLGGALAMEVAADVADDKWINALVTVNGLPFTLTERHYLIPTSMPVQAHFSNVQHAKHFFHLDQIQPLQQKWDRAINLFGGIHSKGFHSMEEHVFFYETESGFLDDKVKLNPGKYSRDEANVCLQRLFGFLRQHLKVL
jgi:dienelactone hydrolase